MLFFSVMNEGDSLFFEDNVEAFLGDDDEKGGHGAHEEGHEGHEDFEESNLMHAINGEIPCRFPLGSTALTVQRPAACHQGCPCLCNVGWLCPVQGLALAAGTALFRLCTEATSHLTVLRWEAGRPPLCMPPMAPVLPPAGYVYCNMPPLRFALGERVRVYIMALGTEVDMHTPNLQRSVFHAPLGAHTMPALGMLPGKRVLHAGRALQEGQRVLGMPAEQ